MLKLIVGETSLGSSLGSSFLYGFTTINTLFKRCTQKCIFALRVRFLLLTDSLPSNYYELYRCHTKQFLLSYGHFHFCMIKEYGRSFMIQLRVPIS